MKRIRRNKHRIAALFLAAVLLQSAAAPALAAGGEMSGGTVLIHSAEDLLALARHCALDTWSRDKTVVLQADISLADVEFAPIPTFGGTFDGGGHTISGLRIDAGVCPGGLFGVLQQGAVVRNLTVRGNVVPLGDANTLGGIVGCNYGKLTGCTFQGYVSGCNRVGGVVGLNETTGQLINCSFWGAVTGEHYVGGIAGQNMGSLIRCTNNGSINTTEIDVEASLLDLNLTSYRLNSIENMPAGTDIGGVAGFSAGVIQNCRNTGDVGYEHMGYNVGGIAGRQSGYLDGCVNRGTVRGRKDVGGIAGQLEPQVTLKYGGDTLSDLWDALDVLEELTNRTLDDAQNTSGTVLNRVSSLTDSVGTVKDTAASLSDAMTDWANANIDQVNDASARLSWMLGQMEPVMEDLSDVLKEANTAVKEFTDALDELEKAGEPGSEAVAQLRLAMRDLKTAAARGGDAFASISSAMTHLERSLGDREKTGAALEELIGGLADLAGAYSDIAAAVARIRAVLDRPETSEETVPVEAELRGVLAELGKALEEISAGLSAVRDAFDRIRLAAETLVEEFDRSEAEMAWQELHSAAGELEKCAGALEQAAGHLVKSLEAAEDTGVYISAAAEHLNRGGRATEKAISLLRRAAGQSADILKELAEKPAIQFRPLNSEVTDRGDALDCALSEMLQEMNALNSTMSASSDVLLADLRAVNRQMGVITGLLRQAGQEAKQDESAGRFEDISDRELYDERTSGRISDARNAGTVEGDVNVGGVVGSMAIEYDFDPEDDLTESGERSLDFRYQTVAVVLGSVNEGVVRAKKDCVGGIVGRMDLGTVYACEGYGSVESTGGDYVGGIAGLSRSAVRGSFAKCTLSGGSFVGGILGAGDADSVTERCCTLVRIAACKQYGGAVSGSEEGKFTGNRFVSEELAGLGRVSYAGKAEPIDYEALAAVEGLPAAFRTFLLTFVASEDVLRRESFEYGASFGPDIYPDLPQKEGCYAQWDVQELHDLRFDTVVTAVYTPYITALSTETVRDNSRSVFYVEGNFRRGDCVEAQALETENAGLEALAQAVFWKGRLLELWRVSFSDDGQREHTLRYLRGEGRHLRVYVRQDGTWRQADSREIGQYLAFSVTGTETEIAVFSLSPMWTAWALAALALLAVLWILRKTIKRRKRRKKPVAAGQ